MSMRKLFVLLACLEGALKNTTPKIITAECRVEHVLGSTSDIGNTIGTVQNLQKNQMVK